MKTYFLLFFIFLNAAVFSQWEKINFPTEGELFMVRFADETTGWVIEENHIYKTIDGGISWAKQDSIYGAFKGSAALAVLNSSTVLYSDYSYRGIRRTSDGGNTWHTADTSSLYYGDIKFINDNTGFAAGGYIGVDSIGIIKRTTDSGETWETIASINTGSINGTISNHMESVSFIDEQNGWAVSYAGLVYKTVDGGIHWAFQDSIGLSNMFEWRPIRDIQFLDQSLGWAVGGLSFESSLCRTNNGGTVWDVDHLTDLTHASLNEIIMLDDLTGWIVGSNNMPAYVAKTTDGGATWQDETPTLAQQGGFESISIKGSTGYMVGQNGIFKNTTTIVTSVDGEMNKLNSYGLEQNYPNPFNPATKIKWHSPEMGKNTIKVYDILGNLISVLVDEVKPAGSYEAEFNAADLASGIYFYQLNVNEFSSTKKMLLIK